MSRETYCYSLTVGFLPAKLTLTMAQSFSGDENDKFLYLSLSHLPLCLSSSLPLYFRHHFLSPLFLLFLLSLRLLTGFWPFSRFSQTIYRELEVANVQIVHIQGIYICLEARSVFTNFIIFVIMIIIVSHLLLLQAK